MLEKIDTHSLRTDLLTGGWVLDVGCRGFGFARALVGRGCKVLALDPDKDITDPHIPGVVFDRVALVGHQRPSATYATWSTGEGNCLCIDRPPPSYSKAYVVSCTTMAELMSNHGIVEFDAVKLDCEGVEFEILPLWDGVWSKQISVEFHDFTGANPRGEVFHTEMLHHLGRWYDCKHERISHPSGIVGYWDSLFVRRSQS